MRIVEGIRPNAYTFKAIKLHLNNAPDNEIAKALVDICRRHSA